MAMESGVGVSVDAMTANDHLMLKMTIFVITLKVLSLSPALSLVATMSMSRR
jgi:hypothetical protein